MGPVTLNDYITLIQSFLNGRIPIADIEEEYNKLFYRKAQNYPEMAFPVLDKLFASIECYDPECLPGQETAFELSEHALRQYATEALAKLEAAQKELS
jgi:hypothetical protein